MKLKVNYWTNEFGSTSIFQGAYSKMNISFQPLDSIYLNEVQYIDVGISKDAVEIDINEVQIEGGELQER